MRKENLIMMIGVMAMNTTVRYHVLPDKAGGGVTIFDAETGRVQYPHCWQDISAYYHYLTGRGRLDEAQALLAECMSGSKPMTRMLEQTCQPVLPKDIYHSPGSSASR
jgi:hypothetical protein